MIAQCGFDLHFSNNVEHLSMCLLAICISFFIEMSVTSSSHFLFGLFFKEPRSALESRRVSLGAHWVDSRESSLLRRLERGREIGR